LKEYTILVPLFDNTGFAYPNDTINRLRLELVEAFGGCTRQDGLIGAWMDEGILYEDINCSLTIATARRDAPSVIIAFARRWGTELSQLAMYVRLPGGKAVIVRTNEE